VVNYVITSFRVETQTDQERLLPAKISSLLKGIFSRDWGGLLMVLLDRSEVQKYFRITFLFKLNFVFTLKVF
jgi:hypothetical protein